MSDRPIARERSYVLAGQPSPEDLTASLQALLPVRHEAIAHHRFTVLDTFDGRVQKAGGRLTRSGANGTATIAWHTPGADAGLAVGLHHPVNFVWDLPGGPLRQRLEPVIGVRRLLELADAESYGSRLDVLDHRGKTVARLQIESGRARRPSPRTTWQGLPTLVTAMPLRGYDDAFERLVSVVESRPGIEPCPEGATGVILGLIGIPPAARDSTSSSSPEPTVRADLGARRIHLTLLGALRAHEPGLRANLDTEFLHDFRVAVRRTRSLLRQIRGVFPPDLVEHFSSEFSWIGRLTGPPRDLDVLILSLRAQREEFVEPDLDDLTAYLGRRHDQEHVALVQALDSDRYHRLLVEWETFLTLPVPFEPAAPGGGDLLTEAVLPRAWRLTRRLAACAGRVDAKTPADALHHLRILAKKLRYLIDATPQFYDPDDLRRVVTSLKKLQQVLGDFNDAHVQQRLFVEHAGAMGAAGGPPGALFVLGRLAERSGARRDSLRGQVLEKLTRFCDDDIRAACRRAFKPAD
jgi:CHAD domain-containing protein